MMLENKNIHDILLLYGKIKIENNTYKLGDWLELVGVSGKKSWVLKSLKSLEFVGYTAFKAGNRKIGKTVRLKCLWARRTKWL